LGFGEGRFPIGRTQGVPLPTRPTWVLHHRIFMSSAHHGSVFAASHGLDDSLKRTSNTLKAPYQHTRTCYRIQTRLKPMSRLQEIWNSCRQFGRGGQSYDRFDERARQSSMYRNGSGTRDLSTPRRSEPNPSVRRRADRLRVSTAAQVTAIYDAANRPGTRLRNPNSLPGQSVSVEFQPNL
jgi:hypothetical protein